MHGSVHEYVERVLKGENINGLRVLEVGSHDVNGTVRPYIESYKPREYVGIDTNGGKGVDTVMSVSELIRVYGKEAFDIVICTEVMEHIFEWQEAVRNMKSILKPGGLILITTRSIGFPRHEFPKDYWRYGMEDIEKIFADFDILNLESDPEQPGVFLLARKPLIPKEVIMEEVNLYKLTN